MDKPTDENVAHFEPSCYKHTSQSIQDAISDFSMDGTNTCAQIFLQLWCLFVC